MIFPASRLTCGRVERLALFLVVQVALGVGQGIAQDKVYPKQGVPASGRLVDITPDEVTIEVRGKNQKYAVHDIRKIVFDGEPNELDRAREHFFNGQFDQALDEINKIAASSITNTVIRQDVEFYRFYCQGKLALAGSEDKNGAIRGLVNVERVNPKTFHLYELSELLGELAMAVDQPEQAARYFNRLLNAPSADTKALGLYRLAQVDLAVDRLADAQKRFSQLVSATSTSPEMARLKSLAEVGVAVCENASGDSAGALKKLDALIDKYDSTNQELFARIYNAKGACYLSLNKPVQALLNYLKTDLLYFSESEPHAEALYHLKQLFPKVGENAKAADAGSRLLANYASSSWANKP